MTGEKNLALTLMLAVSVLSYLPEIIFPGASLLASDQQARTAGLLCCHKKKIYKKKRPKTKTRIHLAVFSQLWLLEVWEKNNANNNHVTR